MIDKNAENFKPEDLKKLKSQVEIIKKKYEKEVKKTIKK